VGDDPIAFVVSINAKRRHLTPSQLAALATEIEAAYAAAAKERQRKAGKTKLPATGPEASGDARDQAAAQVGASGRSVSRAKFVKEHGCDELYQL
jgi:hypothetical protein